MFRVLGIVAFLAVAGCGVYVDQRAGSRAETAEERWPPIGRFTEVQGVSVHYVQKGRGPDVVLLHGAGGNLRDFTFDLVDRLAQSYRVTAFDRPGLGYTERLPQAAGAFNTSAETPQQQAALLSAAARQIGVDDPIVLGHSFGGSIAMAWALNHNAAAVVSVAGAVMPWPGGLDAQYRVFGSALGGALLTPLAGAFVNPDEVQNAAGRIFAPQPVPSGYLPYVGPGLTLRPETLRANNRQVRRLKASLTAMSQRYGQIDAPVELVHGDKDTIVGLDIHANGAARLLPAARVTVLPGVGHMPHHSHAGEVIAAVNRAARRAGLR